MMMSETPRRLNSHWLKACVLVCAVVALPLGIAFAQDYEAVEERLVEAVSKGELSLEQAGVMMAALKKAPDAKKAPVKYPPDAGKHPIKKAPDAKKQAVKSKSDTDLEGAWKKLEAMVKAGELTKDQAIAKMSAIKKEAMKKGPDWDKPKARPKADGGKKGLKVKVAEKDRDSDKARAYLVKIKEELGDAAKAGRITKEEAAIRFAAAEKKVKGKMGASGPKSGSKRLTAEEYVQAEAKLRKAAAEGKISKEDMLIRLSEMRRMVGRKSDGAVKRAPIKKISPEDFVKAKAKIREAIAEGKITEERGRAKLAALGKMVVKQSDGANTKSTDWEAIKKRIEGAVKSGKMTCEEADAKYKELRNKQGQEMKKRAGKGKPGR